MTFLRAGLKGSAITALLLYLYNYSVWGGLTLAAALETFCGRATFLIPDIGLLAGATAVIVKHFRDIKSNNRIRHAITVALMAELAAIAAIPFWTVLSPVISFRPCASKAPWSLRMKEIEQKYKLPKAGLFIEYIPIINHFPPTPDEYRYVDLVHDAEYLAFWQGCVDSAGPLVQTAPIIALMAFWIRSRRTDEKERETVDA